MAKMACAQCGGAKRMKAGGTSTEDPVSKKTVRQGMRAERKMDRQDKRWDKKYEKQKAEELMKSKRFKAGGTTGIVGMPMYGNNPRTQEGRMLKKGGSLPANTTGVKKAYAKGGATASFAPNRAVTASCKNGTVRDASGKCVMERKMAYGGVAKKPLRKAQYGTAGSTAPAPAPAVKKPAFAPPTPEENKTLVSVYNQRNKTTLPDNTPMSPSSENFRTRSGAYNVYRTPQQKTTAPIPAGKRGGTKMAKGGMTKAKKFAALAPPYNKATAADRIAGAKKNKRKK